MAETTTIRTVAASQSEVSLVPTGQEEANELGSEAEHPAVGGAGAEERPTLHITLAADPIFQVGSFPVTNALLVTWIATAILLVVAFRFSKKVTAIPGRFQALLELVFEGLLKFMNGITADYEKTKRFVPLVLTIFFLILTSNWLELLPGFESIFVNGVPLFRAPASDFNLTLSIALIAVIATHVYGVKFLGSITHVKKYVSLNPINMFIGIIELVGDVAKVISFSLRLFGNIFAGSILLLVIGFLVPFVAPLPFMVLELIVGFIQALVFSMLTLVFLTMATIKHH